MAYTHDQEVQDLKKMEEAEKVKEENLRREDEHLKARKATITIEQPAGNVTYSVPAMKEAAESLKENAARTGVELSLKVEAISASVNDLLKWTTQKAGEDIVRSTEEHNKSIAVLAALNITFLPVAIEYLTQVARNLIAGYTDIPTEIQRAIDKSFEAIRKAKIEADELKADIDSIAPLSPEIEKLLPFLVAVLDSQREKIENPHAILSDIIAEGFDEDGNPKTGKYEAIIAEARELMVSSPEIAPLEDRIQSIIPKSHSMPNNALMNALVKKHAINAGAFDLPVIPAKGKRKEITSYIMANLDPETTAGVTITATNMTEYERQVSDAIVSLWKEAAKQKLPPIVTPDMVFRAMPGGSDKPSKQQKGAITKTIEKFRRLRMIIDATDEMRKRGKIGSSDTFKLDDYYLSATHAEYKVKKGGQTVNAYRINAEPIILTYCEMTNQILTVPAKYIAIEKVKKGMASGELLPMTANRQAMTGYLLRRIAVMQHDLKEARAELRSYNFKRKKDSSLEEKTLSDFMKPTVILFSTIFKEVGITTTDRGQQKENRDFCFDVLDYEIVCGNIKGYEPQTKGRTITGIKIIL